MIVQLIIPGLLAVALLGAISVRLPARSGAESFIRRMRSVSTASYVTLLGAWVIAAVASCLSALSARIGPLWSRLIPSIVVINFAYLLRNFFL